MIYGLIMITTSKGCTNIQQTLRHLGYDHRSYERIHVIMMRGTRRGMGIMMGLFCSIFTDRMESTIPG